MKRTAINKRRIHQRLELIMNDCMDLPESEERKNVLESLGRASRELHKLILNEITKEE